MKTKAAWLIVFSWFWKVMSFLNQIKNLLGWSLFLCYCIMSILSNFASEESRNVARQRNVDGYENMCWQKLENVFKMFPASIPTLIRKSRPRPRSAIRIAPSPRPRPIRTYELLPINMDEFEKWKWQKPNQYQEMLDIIGKYLVSVKRMEGMPHKKAWGFFNQK